MNQKVIIAIPGPWVHRDELEQSILAMTHGEYFYHGAYLQKSGSAVRCEIAFYEFNPSLYNAFEIAGRGSLSKDTLRKVKNHRSVVYLQFSTDDSQLRYNMLGFSSVLALVGGVAVKVENSGVAHEYDRWKQLLASNSLLDLYQAMTTVVVAGEFCVSCGMQQFSLPDTTVLKTCDYETAVSLLALFNHYQMNAANPVTSGDTFQMDGNSPCYELDLRDDWVYPEDPYYTNPYGRWVLTVL